MYIYYISFFLENKASVDNEINHWIAEVVTDWLVSGI